MRSYQTAPAEAVARARKLRRNSTDAERKLWRALHSQLPKSKWRRQMPVGPYVVDFACFSEKLVVELDGGQHASQADYDYDRTRFLQREGYRVMRFWNNDVIENIQGVLESIAANLPLPSGEGRGEGKRLTPRPSPSQPVAGVLPLPTGEGIKGAM